jgi:hypothetical protein
MQIVPRRLRTFVLAVVLALGLGAGGLGCATVHPTEREHLADPVMALDLDRDMQRMRAHVLEIREASRGGLGLEGAGCGCN